MSNFCTFTYFWYHSRVNWRISVKDRWDFEAHVPSLTLTLVPQGVAFFLFFEYFLLHCQVSPSMDLSRLFRTMGRTTGALSLAGHPTQACEVSIGLYCCKQKQIQWKVTTICKYVITSIEIVLEPFQFRNRPRRVVEIVLNSLKPLVSAVLHFRNDFAVGNAPLRKMRIFCGLICTFVY